VALRSVAVTYRSIVIALVLMPFNAVYLVLSEVLWLTTAPTALSLFYNVVFILFLLVVANLALEKLRPRWALQPAEFFVIYTMLSLSSALCSIDMLDILVPTLSHLTHFPPIEHRYDQILAHLPEDLVVTDELAAASYYLGQESIYDPRIYMPWLKPLFLWFWFVIALFAVMGGLDLVFRKPWTQYEKLAYPIIQVPMNLVNDTQALLRSRMFWAGFIAVGLLDLMNGFHVLYPSLPHIPMTRIVNLQSFFPERPWSDMGFTIVSFFPFAVGLVFLIPADLAFSCWFFFLFFKMERVLASHIGVHGMTGFPYIEEQTCGGYYAIALLALWMTRRHLRRCARLALGLDVETESRGERRDARLAAVLIVGGLSFLIGFSLHYQMTWWIAVFFFGAYYMIAVAVTRMRAELGYPSHDLHAVGPNFQVVKFLGAPNMRDNYPRDLVMFGFYNFITRAYRAHPMPHGLEAFRIAERMKIDHRRYLLAMAIAVVAGAVIAFWAILWVFTKYGGSNITTTGEWFGRETWEKVDSWFQMPERHLIHPSLAIVFGVLFALGLAALRMNLAWFPFHPVGFAASGSWSMEQLWASFFAGWILKVLVLRYGGAKAYSNSLPLIFGLIMGNFMVGTLWSIYGVIAEQDVYHFWPY
jgi:hypothetical protein